MRRRDILKAALAYGVGCGLPVCAQVLNLNDAINKAGRQRMLTQRIAKAYLQIGMAVDVENSKRILESSLSLFDRQWIELKNYPTTSEIKAGLLNIEKPWSTSKDLLLGKAPNPSDAKKILRLSDTLLDMSNQITQLLELHANSKTGKLLNISGRQRMLSQRMAKLYHAIQWEVAAADGAASLDAARKEFTSNMRFLEANVANTQAIEIELKLANQQWSFFDLAIKQTPDLRMRNYFATTVATTSERILQQMDIITGLYQDS